MLRPSAPLLAGLLAVVHPGPPGGVPVSLSGSPESMARQNHVAVASGYAFLRTPADVRRAVKAGELVRVEAERDLAVKDPEESAARPEVKDFLEHFATRYRAECGERLVVTSLTRAVTRQPPNAHPLSVHPAGMAMDLRVPRRPGCRRWLESRLLALEEQGILDVTREQHPSHYHVALFPDPYLAYMGLKETVEPQVVAAPPTVAAEPVTAPIVLPLDE